MRYGSSTDHNTTTQEAAGHTGGRYGKGGDLLYRWGNPLTYRMGSENDKMLFNQHDAEWINPGFPSGGNILLFNNGVDRPGEDYSSIEEIIPPITSNGSYTRAADSPYGPTGPVWNYTAEYPTDFFAINLGSARRLPNGNTLICPRTTGSVFRGHTRKGGRVAVYQSRPGPHRPSGV